MAGADGPLAKGPRANIANFRSGRLADESGKARKLEHDIKQIEHKPQQARARVHEHQIMREERLGIGSEQEKHHQDPEAEIEGDIEMGH